MIYFLRAGAYGAITIGYTAHDDVRKRIRQLQTAHSEPLTCMLVICGSYSDEERLHERFTHLRLHGEWFKLEKELTDFIQGIQNTVTVDKRYLQRLEAFYREHSKPLTWYGIRGFGRMDGHTYDEAYQRARETGWVDRRQEAFNETNNE